jgi:predicted CoA-binding protein
MEAATVNPHAMLQAVQTILVIDWPSKEVPETLVRAGLQVIVKGGPGPEDYYAYELTGGEVVARRTGRPPEHMDLIYSYRPLSELPGIVASANSLGAKTVWTQSGLSAPGVKDAAGCWVPEEDLRLACDLVESAGLKHVAQPYIGDVAREILASR